MKSHIAAAVLFALSTSAMASPIEGKWYSFDDRTGAPDSEVTIKLVDGELQGHITKVMDPEAEPNAVCTECEGEQENAPILNLQIMSGYSCEGDECTDGEILDPRTGMVYSSELKLVDAETLNVRGYIGSPMFGQSKTWKRNP